MAKKNFPTPQAPRTIEEISSNFSQLAIELGRQQYLVEVHQKNSAMLLEQMNKIDQEATARRDLDAEVAKSKKESESQPPAEEQVK